MNYFFLGPGGLQTDDQIAYQENLESAGGTYILARSLEEVIYGLEPFFVDEMKRIIQLATLLALIAFSGLCGTGIWLMVHLNEDLADTRDQVAFAVATLPGIENTVQDAGANIAALAKTGSQVLAKERGAFDAQQKYFSDLTTRTDTLLNSANKTLEEVNGTILPGTRDLLGQARGSVSDASGRVDILASSLDDEITSAKRATDTIGVIAEDTAQTTANLAGTTADIEAWVHRETTPARGTWNLIKDILRDFAGPAASIGTAVK